MPVNCVENFSATASPDAVINRFFRLLIGYQQA